MVVGGANRVAKTQEPGVRRHGKYGAVGKTGMRKVRAATDPDFRRVYCVASGCLFECDRLTVDLHIAEDGFRGLLAVAAVGRQADQQFVGQSADGDGLFRAERCASVELIGRREFVACAFEPHDGLCPLGCGCRCA